MVAKAHTISAKAINSCPTVAREFVTVLIFPTLSAAAQSVKSKVFYSSFIADI